MKHDLEHLRIKWSDFKKYLFLGKYDRSLKFALLSIVAVSLITVVELCMKCQ